MIRPIPEVADFATLNAAILAALERGIDERRVECRTVREALAEERPALWALPALPLEEIEAAVKVARASGSPRLKTFRHLLCKGAVTPRRPSDSINGSEFTITQRTSNLARRDALVGVGS